MTTNQPIEEEPIFPEDGEPLAPGDTIQSRAAALGGGYQEDSVGSAWRRPTKVQIHQSPWFSYATAAIAVVALILAILAACGVFQGSDHDKSSGRFPGNSQFGHGQGRQSGGFTGGQGSYGGGTGTYPAPGMPSAVPYSGSQSGQSSSSQPRGGATAQPKAIPQPEADASAQAG